MCIERAVGDGGTNTRTDVVIVQILLNFNGIAVAMDGSSGPKTNRAITDFQSRMNKAAKGVPGPQEPAGRIDLGSRTLLALQAGLPGFADPATAASDLALRGIMPTATLQNIQKYGDPLRRGMPRRQINTALRQAHFLAQLGHESAALAYAEELASGDAYEGRKDLGNTQTGDGRRFKGRGLIQLTGRANYEKYASAVSKNLVADDDAPKVVASDPNLAVDASLWFWEIHNLNVLADQDDVTAITRRVNGGLNGFSDRKAYLARAKFFFKI